MLDSRFSFINEEFDAGSVTPDQLDRLLAAGWRHFGTHFFRYSLAYYGFDIRRVIPMRIRLAGFSLSKNQRRVLRRNADLDALVRPIEITPETDDLFERHKLRFDHGVPDSIYNFLSARPGEIPCESRELALYKDGSLVAVSYFDLGRASASGIYAMFEPAESARSLGIFTMLEEIRWTIESGREFYYQGYAYEGNSFYDYKKRFRGSEAYDWHGNWRPFAASEE